MTGRGQASRPPTYLGFLEGGDSPWGGMGGRVIRLIFLLAHFGHGWGIKEERVRRPDGRPAEGRLWVSGVSLGLSRLFPVAALQ